jgi:hypothetical protein
MEFDEELVASARRLITGANVHCVKTWIYCYEVSRPESAEQARYEQLLRDFVRSHISLSGLKHSVALHRRRLAKLNLTSAAINRRVEKLLTSHSD